MMAALRYNENKVKNGKAVCIHSDGFLRDTSELTFAQKVSGFERLNCRNERAKTKTLHISLNFDPSEKLSTEKMQQVAEAYIKGIGFEGQPFLAYRHIDAGHPHIHIVTTTIREDGSRINTHNIGRNQSEVTRKQIEEDFNLIKANDKKAIHREQVIPINTRLIYGKTETRQAINRVVSIVIQNYLFASLAELNVVLRKYGVQAEPGTKGSRVNQHRGLNYRMLDEKSTPVGVPIKASLLSIKPTVKKLETLFEKNRPLKEAFKTIIKKEIDETIAQVPADLSILKKILANKNIDLVLRTASDGSGRVYGITFIDEKNRVVFNGSDLGKKYSAAHLQSSLHSKGTNQPFLQRHTSNTSNPPDHSETLVDILLQTEQQFNFTPSQLKKKKKKRKQKYLGL